MYYPYGYYYGFDWTYLYLVLPCVLLSLWASHNVNSTFKKYSQQFSVRRLTGAEAAQRVLSANGVHGVRIERVSGNLTDHFDPKTNVSVQILPVDYSRVCLMPGLSMDISLAPDLIIGFHLFYYNAHSYQPQ